MSIFRKKTKTSLEDELKKIGDLYNSVMNTVDRIEKMIENFKSQGRINDAIFAAKIATIWSSNGDYLRFCIIELKKSIETGKENKSYRLSEAARDMIRQGTARLVGENYQLYDQIISPSQITLNPYI